MVMIKNQDVMFHLMRYQNHMIHSFHDSSPRRDHLNLEQLAAQKLASM
jgi:hypothetical protein